MDPSNFVVTSGDARVPADYARALADRRAQLLFTDPPYCLLTRRRKGGDVRDAKERKNERGPQQRFETVKDYRAFTEAWLSAALPRLADGAPLVVWTNLLGKEPIATAAKARGYSPAGEFVWGKRTREGNSGEELLRVVEVALVFTAAPPAPLADGDPPRVWAAVAGYDDDAEAARWGNHPNHKPFGVLEPLVRAWSRPGDLVLDPFAGSGSLPAAALRLGRRAACLELLPEWAARVSERLAAL